MSNTTSFISQHPELVPVFWIQIPLFLAAGLVSIFLSILCIIYRHFLPLKVKDVPLAVVYLLSSAGVLCAHAVDSLTLLLDISDDIVPVLSGWLASISVVMMICSFLSRMMRKFVIFMLQDRIKLSNRTFKVLVSTMLYTLPFVCLIVLLRILSTVGKFVNIEWMHQIVFAEIGIAVLLSIWALTMGIIQRKIRHEFNDYGLTILAIIVSSMIFCIVLPLLNLQLYIYGEILRLILDPLIAAIGWVLVLKPLYYCFFARIFMCDKEAAIAKRDAYENRFKDGMSARTAYNMIVSKDCRELFLRQCALDYCSESARFILDVHDYTKISIKDIEERFRTAVHIYETYIRETAPQEINVNLAGRLRIYQYLTKAARLIASSTGTTIVEISSVRPDGVQLRASASIDPSTPTTPTTPTTGSVAADNNNDGNNNTNNNSNNIKNKSKSNKKTVLMDILGDKLFYDMGREIEILLAGSVHKFISSRDFESISIEKRRGLLESVGILDENLLTLNEKALLRRASMKL